MTLSPLIRVTKTAQFMFRCDSCGQVDLYPSGSALPFHCSRSMALIKKMWFGGDEGEMRLSSLELDEKVSPLGFPITEKAWPSNWKPAYELWKLHHGRVKGERIGWYGKIELLEAWEWIMVPGVSPQEGRSLSKIEAISVMWNAINR